MRASICYDIKKDISLGGSLIMERKFILSSESTVDLPYSHMAERDIPIIFYYYTVNDVDYVDDMGRDPEARPNFYRMLDEGAVPSTSLINQQRYTDFFEELLQKGDVLHIAFTSGQSSSVRNALAVAEELQEKYPDRTIKVVDSLCSSSGMGQIVDYIADMADAGCTLDEAYEWALANRNKFHHQFFTSNMTQFRRTGRVSGPTAAIATILNICPIMRLDDGGRIISYSKVRGKKRAVAETVSEMKKHAINGTDYDGKCYICNSNCIEDARMLETAIEEEFPNLRGKIVMCDIGTIIASHSGPGTVAVFFMGDERLPQK